MVKEAEGGEQGEQESERACDWESVGPGEMRLGEEGGGRDGEREC